MSGPKTSRYKLTPEQRRQLEEQLMKLREELIRKEKVALAQKTLNGTIKRLSQSLSDLEYIDGIESDKEIICAINEAKEKIKKSEMLLKSENINGIYAVINEIETMAERIQLCLNRYAIERKKIRLEQSEALDNLIAMGFTVEFKKMPNQDELKYNQYYQKIQLAISRLGRLHLSQNELVRLQEIKAMSQEIDSTEFIKNYYSITVFPFVEECEFYNKSYIEHFDEFIELMSTYKALLQECKLPNKLRTEEFSMELLQELRVEVNKLKSKILEEEEEAYISKCIDETMDEMGYRRVGSREVVKKSGRHFRYELYKFAEGTAVDVTYSDDGQVIMELGVVDNQDREPSEEECRSLTEDMELFCSSYASLEKTLIKKGVVRKNVLILPASAEYAQVINKNDYEIENDMEGFAQSGRRHTIRGVNNEPLYKHIGE
jgi:hypothetical protein